MMYFFRKKTPVIYQLSETECGIASLAMIFAYYGCHLSFEKLREMCGVSRDGCKGQTLINVAQHCGFDAEAYSVDTNTVCQLASPVIAYWNFNHYVVINKVKGNKAFINDPGHGAITLSMDEFDKAFTGVIINLTPTKDMVKTKKTILSMRAICQWFNGFHQELLFIFLCLLIMSLAPYLNTTISNIFVDQCVISNNSAWVPYCILFTIIAAVILFVTTYKQKTVQFKLYCKVGIVKSSLIVSQILQLPMLFFSLRQRSEIISIFAKAETVINLLFKGLLNQVIAIVTSLFCLLIMIKLNFILSIVSILSFFVALIFFYALTKVNLSYEKSNLNLQGKLYATSISSIKNIETIKACSLEAIMLKKWKQMFFKKIMLQDKINIINILVQVLHNSYHSFLTLTLLCLGGYQISKGLISVGNLMAYYALHIVFYNHVLSFLEAVREYQSAHAYDSRIQDILSYEKDKRYLPKKPIDISPLGNDDVIISLSKVSFQYNMHVLPPVLQNISLEIKKGEHIAFVGGTGSGKSTLSKLLSAEYQPSMGCIRAFGRELSSYSANEIAKCFACVAQDITLFSGNLYENLTLLNRPVALSDISKVLDLVCLTEFINQHGLYARVEEEGRNFSGGERQRIEIARALLQDTPILILDEATSALDTKTESELINNLRATDKTILFIAHRLSSIVHCDKIFVMHKGEIVEQGNHQQLISNRGHYYSLISQENRNDLEKKMNSRCKWD